MVRWVRNTISPITAAWIVIISIPSKISVVVRSALIIHKHIYKRERNPKKQQAQGEGKYPPPHCGPES